MNSSAYIKDSDTTNASVYTNTGIHLLLEHPADFDGQQTLQDIVTRIQATPSCTLADIQQIVETRSMPPASSCLAAVEVTNVLYLVSRGGGSMFVRRDGTTRRIIQGTTSASGIMKEGDVYIACSPSLHPGDVDYTQSTDEIARSIGDAFEQQTPDAGSCLIVQYEPHQETANPVQQKTTPFISPHIQTLVATKHQRMTLGIGIVLLMMLGISVVFGNAHRKNILLNQAFASIQETVSKHVTEAESLGTLNEQAAAETLLAAKKSIDEALPVFSPDSDEYKQLETLRKDIESRIRTAQHIYTIEQPDLFFDISWVKNGGTSERFHLSDDTITMVDTKLGSLYTVPVSKKNADLLATNEIFKNVTAITSSGNNIYLLASTETGIIDKNGTTRIGPDEQWGTIVDIEAFGGNIYALDTNGSIGKYTGQEEGGVGEMKQWIAPDISVDLSQARSMSIDGSIWVLDDTSVRKFHNTVPEVFYLKGDLLQSPKQIYTHEEIDNLYILEDNRVIVFDKSGNYQEQYLWDGFKEATDIVVTKDPTKILILAKDKIYGIDLPAQAGK